jgi:hypothetical protein
MDLPFGQELRDYRESQELLVLLSTQELREFREFKDSQDFLDMPCGQELRVFREFRV